LQATPKFTPFLIFWHLATLCVAIESTTSVTQKVRNLFSQLKSAARLHKTTETVQKIWSKRRKIISVFCFIQNTIDWVGALWQ
jgi:hypothetical protein